MKIVMACTKVEETTKFELATLMELETPLDGTPRDDIHPESEADVVGAIRISVPKLIPKTLEFKQFIPGKTYTLDVKITKS